MDSILLATSNPHKLHEVTEILAPLEPMLGSFQSALTAVSDELRGLQT